jgi:hypothetical protein
MAKRITPRPYWEYDEMEEGVIVAAPIRGSRTGPTDEWSYDHTPKIGEHVHVINNKDGDGELTIELALDTDGQYGSFYIWHECVRPVSIPIPEDIDLTKPTDIEKWLEDA